MCLTMYKTQSENNPRSGSSWLRNNWCYLPKGQTMNSRSYCDLLQNHLRPAIHRKHRGLLSKGACLRQHNARPHTANATTMILQRMKFEVLPHPLIPQTWRRLIFICLGHWKMQIQLGWRCPVSNAWVAQGPTTRVLFFWHPSAGFPLAQVQWTAGGLCWTVSRYFPHWLNEPHCSTTFPVIFWLYLVHSNWRCVLSGKIIPMMLTFTTGTTLNFGALKVDKWMGCWVCSPWSELRSLQTMCTEGAGSSQMLVAHSHWIGLHHFQQNFFSVVTSYQKK